MAHPVKTMENHIVHRWHHFAQVADIKGYNEKTKTEQSLEHINKLKERFQHLSTETIVSRLINFNKT